MSTIQTVFVGSDPRIAADVLGTGDLVIFVHGVGGNKRNWHDNMPAFAKHFRAVAIDCRGYGESDDYEGPLKFEDFAHDIARVLDHFGSSKAHVVGLSMGSEIAPVFATLYPDRVSSLILCATLTGTPDMTEEAKADFLNSRREPLLNGKEPEDIAPNVAKSLASPSAPQHVVDKLVDSISRLHKMSYLKTIEAELQVDNRDILSAIRVPTLVVAGDADTLTTVGMCREVATLVKGAQFEIIPGAGHLINIEQPGTFDAVCLRFLLAQGA